MQKIVSSERERERERESKRSSRKQSTNNQEKTKIDIKSLENIQAFLFVDQKDEIMKDLVPPLSCINLNSTVSLSETEEKRRSAMNNGFRGYTVSGRIKMFKNHSKYILLLMISAIAFSTMGCAANILNGGTNKVPEEITGIPASEVIKAVKSELVLATNNPKSDSPIEIYQVDIELQTTGSSKASGKLDTDGLIVIPIDAKGSISGSQTATLNLVIKLDPPIKVGGAAEPASFGLATMIMDVEKGLRSKEKPKTFVSDSTWQLKFGIKKEVDASIKIVPLTLGLEGSRERTQKLVFYMRDSTAISTSSDKPMSLLEWHQKKYVTELAPKSGNLEEDTNTIYECFPSFRDKPGEIAKNVISNEEADYIIKNNPKLLQSLKNVVNYFEAISSAYQSKVADKEMFEASFQHLIGSWYGKLQGFIVTYKGICRCDPWKPFDDEEKGLGIQWKPKEAKTLEKGGVGVGSCVGRS